MWQEGLGLACLAVAFAADGDHQARSWFLFMTLPFQS